jgi:predicted Rossmann-fold nucleotide-binding protein
MTTQLANPVKSYMNTSFLNSREARMIRVICEFEEPRQRLRAQGVKETIMIFGSARAKSREQYTKDLDALATKLEASTISSERTKLEDEISRLKKNEWICDAMDTTKEIARRLTEWAMSYEAQSSYFEDQDASSRRLKKRKRASKTIIESNVATMPKSGHETHDQDGEATDHDVLHGKSSNPYRSDSETEVFRARKQSRTSSISHGDGAAAKTSSSLLPTEGVKANPQPFKQTLMVCTGGGPGLMAAANEGAALVPGAKSIGMKITLPFEQKPNPFIAPELCFQFHYFFTRKYWMLYACRGLIVAPGGFGTMDELFELLTLKRSGKIEVDVPIVLLGKK